MKYVIVLGDGMSDRPVKSLGGHTPLEAARKPMMDHLASRGMVGIVRVFPEEVKPGSDTANLSILGYHPGELYTGRGPLEAASLGVALAEDEVAFRMNLVSVEGDIEAGLDALTMEDYSSGHISSKEASEIVESLKDLFDEEPIHLYAGNQYRHLLVTRNHACENAVCFPPHDHMDEPISQILPQGDGADYLIDLIDRSRLALVEHPVNQKRLREGKKTADIIWPWGQGKAPRLSKLTDRYGITGSMISAVDLLQGLGAYAGLEVLKVEGATGYHDTNYENKAATAIETLRQKDFVFVHVESTDEAGHEGDVDEKIRGIERLDQRIVKPIFDYLKQSGEPFKMLVLPDHATPVELRVHVNDNVPFVLYSSEAEQENGAKSFSEPLAQATGVFINEGWRLMDLMISGLSG